MRYFKVIVLFLLFTNCKSNKENFPSEKIISTSYLEIIQEKNQDSVTFVLKNKLPYSVYFYAKDSQFDAILQSRYHHVKANSEIIMQFNLKQFIPFSYSPCNFEVVPKLNPEIYLPFESGKSYKILQGFNGSFTHTKLNNRFALDFQMAVGEKICSVADGIVIEVVSGYKNGGVSDQWNGFDNYIWIYHPELNLISVYAHLKFKGSLVEVGDRVKANQAIGLSGNTGYSTEPHLHFAMLKLNERKDWETVPYSFIEGYNGEHLRKGDWIRK